MPRRSTGSEAISCQARSICEIVEPGTKIIPLAGFVDPCYDVEIPRAFGKTPVQCREIAMTAQPEQWWADVQIKLSDLLQTLDQHDEPLIAAHVAMALECLHTRIPGLQDGPV